MTKKTLKHMPASKVWVFKIKNRRGFAAICLNNLTEGTSPNQAFQRMAKAVKRLGFQLTGSPRVN